MQIKLKKSWAAKFDDVKLEAAFNDCFENRTLFPHFFFPLAPFPLFIFPPFLSFLAFPYSILISSFFLFSYPRKRFSLKQTI